MSQQQGNDLVAPEPLATTGTDESAQGTIEDKLMGILSDLLNGKLWTSAAHRQIQAIITTETTKAKLYELQRLLPQMTVDEYGLWVRQQIAERIHALQKEQKR